MIGNLEIYQMVIDSITQYYKGRNFRYMFLHGGCYWLAATLHKYIRDSEVVINYRLQHCACRFDKGVYDITGRISGRGFFAAEKKDFSYMEKHFKPYFDTEPINNHAESLECMILKSLDMSTKSYYT